MTNEVSVFQFNQSQQVRVIVRDGEPWFCAADVCRVLDIKNGKHLVKSRLDADGVVQDYLIDSMGRRQQNNMINEPNLYRLIFRSDKNEAKQFQDWVFNDVLPQIRKAGSYQGDMPKVLSITHAQRMELKNKVDRLHTWLYDGQQVSQPFYNMVRVKYQIKHIEELPRVHFDEVMQLADMIRKRVDDVLGFMMDFKKQIMNEYIMGGAPWTPTIKKHWEQQFMASLPERPNWLEMNNQLKH
jgi:prophage antirepressor-like protein